LQDNHRAVALSQPTSTGQPPSTELLMQVVHYVMENLQVDLSVPALARRFSLKESSLLPAFESHTGVALEQFVLRRRIERALHILKNSNASDKEIAMSIGLGSAPEFQTAFSRYVGVSPIEYRSGLPQAVPARSQEGRKRPCRSASVPRRESVLGRLAQHAVVKG
jgi:transcriptional regulator GlxA family with amidase domain